MFFAKPNENKTQPNQPSETICMRYAHTHKQAQDNKNIFGSNRKHRLERNATTKNLQNENTQT